MRRKTTLLFGLLLLVWGGLMAQIHCSFTPSSQFACAPGHIVFTDNSTGPVTSYYWDFDNGSFSTHQNDSTDFLTPGVYNVLHVVSNGIVYDSMYMQIRIYQAPIDSFISYDNIGCNTPCHTVDFVNRTILGDTTVFQYVWDFGDHSDAVTGTNVSHAYCNTGSFDVTLIVRDNHGCEVRKTIPSFVVIHPGPTGNLTANPTQSCVDPTTVNFTGSGSSPNGSVTYMLFCGNGATSASPNFSTSYHDGIYNPYLIVTDV
ncbi:MAG TPA: PKD domain-containing protein, partial [Chitinophagales bacterium]|nr:PKD domain-containing protein [Chitinophagales bacterium]